MADNIFDRLCNDLLQLEIKTILKENSPTGDKMPSNFREAFYKLAGKYHAYMKKIDEELGMEIRGKVYWEFGGMFSFKELKERARQGVKALEKQIASETDERKARNRLPPEGSDEGGPSPGDRATRMKFARRILERIVVNSEQMISIFKELEPHPPKGQTVGGGDRRPDSETESHDSAPPHQASCKWNNDIPLKSIQDMDDLPLHPEHTLSLRKAWNISTEEIVMQTTIDIDGDVTTRILRGFAKNPNETVLTIHNQSIEASVGMWRTLVKTVANMAGVAVKSLFKKTR